MIKKKSNIIIIAVLSISIALLIGISSFLAYYFTHRDKFINNSESTGSNNNSNETTIELNLDNYSEYFTLQKEIVSYTKTDYINTIGSHDFQRIKINQVTKISIIQLKENIKFNNVSLSIAVDNYALNKWIGQSGSLVLAFDGTGSLTLNADFDGQKDSLGRPPPQLIYKVTYIYGTITINNL